MELLRALGAILDPPSAARAPLERALGLPGRCDAAEHTDLFTFQLHPYASVHLGAEGMLGGEARDRVAGFWRALRLVPPAEPDHLAVLLALSASLSEAAAAEPDVARRALRERSRDALLREHVASWVPVWLVRVQELGGPFHRAWADVLMEAIATEARGWDDGADLPLQLRAAPPALDGGSDEADLLAALLAPVRSGLIVTRADLARAARDLDLGLRAGERRYALAALAAQEPVTTIRWLAAEAERQAESHRRIPASLASVTRFWTERAATTARVLTAMAACPSGVAGP